MTLIRSDLNLVMRKPAFCICKNKDVGNREADQRLCFRYTDSTIPLLHVPKSEFSCLLPSSLAVQFVSDQVGNPEDRLSHNEAHFVLYTLLGTQTRQRFPHRGKHDILDGFNNMNVIKTPLLF